MRTIIYLISILFIFSGCNQDKTAKSKAEDFPPIFPDYKNVTIPKNIAPLNFSIEDAKSMQVRIFTQNGNDNEAIKANGGNYVNIPIKKWRQLLNSHAGEELNVSVSVWNDKHPEGIEYKPFTISISKDTIDNWIAYRLVDPGYAWGEMSICQRDLTSFEEAVIVSNRNVREKCFNCHSFCSNDADILMFYVRGDGGGTFIKDKNGLTKMDFTKIKSGRNTTYNAWHPSGDYIAFSCNTTRQSFYKEGSSIEVYDLESDLVVYDRKGNQLLSKPELSEKETLETFPAWSPDGKYIYYCGANLKELPFKKDSIKYSLCRIGFDPANGTFSDKIDTLAVEETKGKSVSFPRISNDNKYLLYTESDCGTFPIWHREADLKMIRLEDNSMVDTSILNSPETDSFHSWSSNSKWIVFSSRRIDARYTRLYLAHIDENGNWNKPFLLPQKNPFQNTERLKSYNIPELINKKVDLNQEKLKDLL